MKQIDKANELSSKFGTDIDEIMTKTKEELDMMYPGEIDDENHDMDEIKILRDEIALLEDELKKLIDEIEYLVFSEIPSDEELVESSYGMALTEARHDLNSDKMRLAKCEKRKSDIEKLLPLKKEKLRRLLPLEDVLYDDPEDYERMLMEEELSDIESKLKSKNEEIEETKLLYEETRGYMQKIEYQNDISELYREVGLLETRRRELYEKLGKGARK